MAQYLRPSSDISTGGWRTQTGSLVNLYQQIDEASANDADYIYSYDGVTAYETLLTTATDPNSSTGHYFQYRASETGDESTQLTVSLYQGATLIAADAPRTLSGTATDYFLNLTGTQADSITNYADLRLRFVVTGLTTGNALVYWAEMGIPNASNANANNSKFLASF